MTPMKEITEEEAKEYAIGLAIELLRGQLARHSFGKIKRAAVENFVEELKNRLTTVS